MKNAQVKVVAENSKTYFPDLQQFTQSKTFQNSLSSVFYDYFLQYVREYGQALPTRNLYDLVIQQVEKPLIEILLSFNQGNQSKTASMLGLNRNTLRKKIETLQINIEDLPHFDIRADH